MLKIFSGNFRRRDTWHDFLIDECKQIDMKPLGFFLIIIGIIMLIWTGFTYTKREKVIDAGPLEVSADKEKSVNWPPYAGGVLVIGGIVLLVASAKKRI